MRILKTWQKLLEKSAILLINFYRNYLSCLMLPRCRFYPTCSAYACEAVEKKGLFRGLRLAILRLLRCHPLSQAPFHDPVKKD